MMLSICFLAVASAWLALPLVPALRELRRPTDACALDVFQGNAADAREGLHTLLPQLFAAPESDWSSELSRKNAGLLPQARLEETDAILFPNMVHIGTLTVAGCPAGLKSLHAQALSLANRLSTGVKLTANTTAIIAPGAIFQVLQAPLILAGTAPHPPKLKAAIKPAGTVIGATHYPAQEWWRASGDAQVEAGFAIEGDILVKGDLIIRRDARVNGSVKASGTVSIEDGGHIHGNVVATRVTLGPGVSVRGCILADDAVLLDEGVVVGAPDCPATIVSKTVVLNAGSRVYGGICASDRACVPIRYTPY